VTEILETATPFNGKAAAAKSPREPRNEPETRHDWSTDEVLAVLAAPLLDLIDQARAVHRRHHAEGEVQLASLLSIKTGACPEDCKYCAQSAHYAKATGLKREKLLDVDEVLAKARIAKQAGANRFCMGAAWREVKDGPEFDAVLAMVRGVRALGMEACVTLGMLTQAQAERLAEAGLTAYNHNLDTSPEFYGEIITTRTYQDRLDTLARVRKAGVQVCCGGIIGMGETVEDRARLLETLANLDPHPESVPINALAAVPGTPLQGQRPVDPLDLVRMVATARILMPLSRVRLSAGRRALSREAQILCFLAGANSIFYGDKLLTTANSDVADDLALIEAAGLSVQPTSPESAAKSVDEASAPRPDWCGR
jgi:biotin synthase